MCFGLFYAQSFHQPPVLLRGKRLRFGAGARPLEAAAFQPLIHKYEAVPFPKKRFHSVTAPTAKQEQGIGKRVKLEALLNDAGQAIYPLSEIRVAAGDIDTLSPCEITQHDFNKRRTASIVVWSAPEYMSASAFPIRTVTDT